MRAAIGIVSLLLALAIVGLLAKKQLVSTRSAVHVLQLQPAVEGTPGTSGAGPASPATVRAQSQQVQQQVKQTVEGLMQQARPMPDDEK